MKLSEYLASLGKTPDEVANSLRQQGVKGLVQSSYYCPILNGIYKACPNYWSGLRISNGVKIDGHWSYYASLNDSQICDPVLPQPVMDFIGRFDSGEYPDLVAKSVKTVANRVWDQGEL